MWDNVRLLNGTANLLFTLVALALAWTGGKQLVESSAYPIRTISIEGNLTHVGRSQIVAALQGHLTGTFFSMDIASVQAYFQSIPWVRKAEVRRSWPDRLQVRLEEHVALARWGQPEDGRLVNSHGEAFDGSSDEALPVFAGPSGTEAEVARRYAMFRQMLAPLRLEPSIVMLSPRYSWQLRLSNGLAIQIGRDADKDGIADRLRRFVSVYPETLGSLDRKFDYVDLRYPNGFALRVPGIGELPPTPNKSGSPSSVPRTRKSQA